MQIIHDTIKIYCFDVLVGNNIFSILGINEMFMTCAICTWKLCLSTVLRYKKIVMLYLDEKVKSMYNHSSKNNSRYLYLCVIF